MDRMNEYMTKTIKEVRAVLRMDRQDAARQYGASAQEVDRLLMNRAVALLDAMMFFLGMADEEEKPDEKG